MSLKMKSSIATSIDGYYFLWEDFEGFPSPSDLELYLSMDQVDILFVHLDNMRMGRAFIDIFHEFLKHFILALSFTLNLE